MKSRKEAARLIEELLSAYGDSDKLLKEGGFAKNSAWHVGRQEFRLLMDFIYGGPPTCKEEEIKGWKLRNGFRG